ncbi:MAG TPA: sigma-70 family RNA polymerase sigma factor [Longimicrobiaceae bacterium]|nr:sigma-70 family RNA polymerase sigma factor [Longimicrobiaceae bacterium]
MDPAPAEPRPRAEVTGLLRAASSGDREAFDRLFPLVYEELRALAGRQLRRESPGHTLEATGLVHEAYVKLAVPEGAGWSDRAHFFAIASRAMRQVLVDHARRRGAQKRGGAWARTTLSGKPLGLDTDPEELLALDAALEGLDPRQRQIVEMRFFGGMTEEEVAEALGVSDRTVRREWVKARAWLYSALYPDGG